VDEHGSVVGQTGRLYDSHNHKADGVSHALGLAMREADRFTHLHTHFAGYGRTDHRFKNTVLFVPVLEISSLGELVLFVPLQVVNEVVEHRGRGADGPKAAEIVAQTDGDGQFGIRGELAWFSQVRSRLASKRLLRPTRLLGKKLE